MSASPVGQASRLPESAGRQDACPTDACPTWLRRSLYALLIVLAASLTTARIMRNRSPDAFSPTPFQSANDKSRWCTIRALGDHGIYSIEHIIFYADGSRVRGWHTIDLVRHRGPDGREHYYSSKPTLLSTLLAGKYWLIKQVTGLSLAEPADVWPISRIMLVLTNVIPLVIALALLARMIDQLGKTDFGRLFAMACACLATFVTTFTATLNNHSLAACTLVFALAAAIPILQNRGRWWHLALAGLFFAFTAANELPALSLLLLAAAALAWKSPLKTAAFFVPPVLVVAAAALGTNYYAHGSWRTAYAHRQDGPMKGLLPDSCAEVLNEGRVPEELQASSAIDYDFSLSDEATIEVKSRGDRWELFDPQTHRRWALQRTPEGSRSLGIEIRQWDNWYDYPGTHWDPTKLTGIDRGEPSPLVYAFHCLVGHHGLFSLTPIWLLSVAGCWMWLRRQGGPTVPLGHALEETSSSACPMGTIGPHSATTRVLAIATISITLVVLAFYLSRPLIDRNYGGHTTALRWMIWLTPLWLLTLVPAADWLGQSRRGRATLLALFAISAFSAHYGADNPWTHPWLYQLGQWLAAR
jgi:hypothetical protein